MTILTEPNSIPAGRILLVDDEEALLLAFTRVLAAEGFAVIPCASAALALERFAKEPFDAIVSDVSMPGLSGIDLLRFVELEPEIVKLDISLIRDIDRNHVKQGLVRSMTSLTKDMGLLVVAEGIETAAERDKVVELGADFLQGYLFGRPERELMQPRW